MYHSSYENQWKEIFHCPLLTFVSGLQTIPAPSSASSINVPTHVPLLCTIPSCCICVHPHLCCICGHPYIFFSLQSHLLCPIITSYYCSVSILRSCLCHGFMIFSFVSQYSISLFSATNTFTAAFLCIQISVLYVKRVK